MGEHWIPAAKAYALTRSALALCARLHAGLVKARATLLTVKLDRETREGRDVAVPARFWWAEGHDALHQDWEKGDFSTWIDHKVHYQAFGVSFALGGILEMLPLERRAIVARQMSVAGSDDWLPAGGVRDAALAAGVDPEQVSLTIIKEATFGFLTARAVSAEGTSDGAKPDVWQEREWDMPPWFWSWLPANGSLSWDEGHVRAQGQTEQGFRRISAAGVHFLKASVSAVFPQPEQKPANQTKAMGGRPPAEFTDDLWAAISGKIFRGEVHPDKKAEIARAMLDWAAANGHEMGETAAKTKARKLHAELHKKA